MKARKSSADVYDMDVREMSLEEGDRVLVWSPELARREGNKIFRPWLGPYRVEIILSPVSYILTSEMVGKTARVHRNRIRKISSDAKQTCTRRNGVLPDSLRLLKRMQESTWKIELKTEKEKRG